METKTQPLETKVSADIEVENGGSLFLFRPLTDAGREWLNENVAAESWQWFGGALAVEHRYAGDLAQGAQEAGLRVI